MKKDELIKLIEALKMSEITYFSMNYKDLSYANVKEINWNNVEE